MMQHLKHWLHRCQYRERYQLLDQLSHTQAMRQDEVILKQQAALSDIIRHATLHTRYYRDKYTGMPLPAAGAPIDTLPILRKSEVIAHKDAMLADSVDSASLRLGRTGGSTGSPVAFYYDQHKMELMRAGMLRSYQLSSWQPGQKILNFWGARQDLKTATVGKQISDFIAAEKTLAAYDYTEADLALWVKQIRHYKPVLLQGYASILAELARYILDQDIQLPAQLIGVYSTAEMLHDWQRQLMQRAFNCNIYNQYGSREIPNIGCECAQGNLHIFTDMVYLESVREDQEDKLIITSLTNRVMPMIRYDIGDSGTLKTGDCACGSPFPLLEMGVCRSNDLIKTSAGKNVYPSYFIHLLDGFDGIKQFQFVQTGLDALTLNLHATRTLSSDEQYRLQSRVRREVDADMRLDIRHVETLARTHSGKHRFVVREFE